MKFGVHVGIGKGFTKTVDEALAAGCECIQIFAGNPRAFKIAAFNAPAWEEFRKLRKSKGIGPVVIHTSYLVNFATADKDLHRQSAALVASDLSIAGKGGIEYVNTHLGSYGDQDRAVGLARVCDTIKKLIANAPPGPMLLLENSAGGGNSCGSKLDELGEILRTVGSPRVGVCLDTAHAWASGYELSTEAGIARFLNDIRRHIGFKRVRALHLNDTKVALGAHRDLHWHVGDGAIGDKGFRMLLATPQLSHVAGICETPKTPELDAKNVATLRRLAGVQKPGSKGGRGTSKTGRSPKRGTLSKRQR
jgi:deoxyribonuclease-4